MFTNLGRSFCKESHTLHRPICIAESYLGKLCNRFTLTHRNIANVYLVRSQSTKINFDEQKLERFLKHLSWDQLESKYSIKLDLVHEKLVLNLLKEKDKLEQHVLELETMKEKEGKFFGHNLLE